MNELAKYLLENVQIDFQGNITVEEIREYLRKDETPESRALLSKIIEDKGIDDLLIVLADCLVEFIGDGISPDVVKEQLMLYSES